MSYIILELLDDKKNKNVKSVIKKSKSRGHVRHFIGIKKVGNTIKSRHQTINWYWEVWGRKTPIEHKCALTKALKKQTHYYLHHETIHITVIGYPHLSWFTMK